MENVLENITGHIGLKSICALLLGGTANLLWTNRRIDGKDLGPDPFLHSSLAACTLSTLRMYIDRKGWDIPEINISLNFYQESDPELTTTISRSIRFPTEIEDD
jgi:putative redox protein